MGDARTNASLDAAAAPHADEQLLDLPTRAANVTIATAIGAPENDEFYDLCLVFPGTPRTRKPDAQISPADCVKMAAKIFPARFILNDLPSAEAHRRGSGLEHSLRILDLSSLAGDCGGTFHPAYGFSQAEGEAFGKRPIAHADLSEYYRDVVFRVCHHLNVQYSAERSRMGAAEALGDLFLRLRLSDEGCRAAATYRQYPLQFSQTVSRHPVFREGGNQASHVLAPYEPYGLERENHTAHLSSSIANYGKLWKRFADDGGEGEFRDVDRIRLIYMSLSTYINFHHLKSEGYLVDLFVLKKPRVHKQLCGTWATWKKLYVWSEPIEQIRDYAGEEVAFYFFWLKSYTKALCLPAACGVLLTVLVLIYDRDMDYDVPWLNKLRLLWCVGMGLWSTYFFCEWQRTFVLHCLRWGLNQYAGRVGLKELNPKFVPDRWVRNPVEPDTIWPTYSPLKKRIVTTLSNCVMFVCALICMVVVNDDIWTMLVSHFLAPQSPQSTTPAPISVSEPTSNETYYEPEKNTTLRQSLNGTSVWRHGVAKSVAAVTTDAMTTSPNAHLVAIATITAILIKLLDKLWSLVIVWKLTDWENHQFSTTYVESANYKQFFFKVMDYFVILSYLAFFKEYVDPCTDSDPDTGRCVKTLRRQLLVLVVLELLEFGKKLIFPSISRWYWHRRLKPRADTPEYQKEFLLTSWNPSDIGSEFVDQMVSFGFTSMFSLILPILPLIMIPVNLIEIRGDAIKMMRLSQRPMPRHEPNMTLWDDVQKAMTFLAIIVNVALLAFATLGHGHSLAFRLFWCLLLVLAGFALKQFVEFVLPAQSSQFKLQRAQAKQISYEALWQMRDPARDNFNFARPTIADKQGEHPHTELLESEEGGLLAT